MRRRNRRTLVFVVLLAAACTATALAFWPKGDPPKPETPEDPDAKVIEDVRGAVRTTGPAGETARGPAPATKPTGPPLSRGQAARALAEGTKLYQAGKLVEARTTLARAYRSGKLAPAVAETTRKLLAELADKTIFSARVYEGDPYTFHYVFKPEQVLQRVERRQKLRVPWQIILKINGIRRAENIRAGQRLKMIRGPFHAIVHRSTFAMELFLDDVFVRRLKVCIGAPETETPAGFFRVTLGGKLENAPYTPPPSSGLPQKAILPGEPGYPLDRRGLWISLTGIAEKGTTLTKEDGYGIHGTNDLSSIGKAKSHGCIRLADKDIDLVFSLLYEKMSTVEVRK